MKNAKRLLACFLLLTVFVSGNGVVVSIHTCLSSASKYVSLYKEKGCCSEEKQNECDGERLKSNCCFSEMTYHKINVPLLHQKNFEIQALTPEIITFSSTFLPKQIDLTFPEIKPPLLGNSILLRCGQLLI